jgi:hypothetical protein
MAQPLACRFGLHRYRWVGPPGKKQSYRACTRCGKRRHLWDMSSGVGTTATQYRERMGLDDDYPPDTGKR